MTQGQLLQELDLVTLRQDLEGEELLCRRHRYCGGRYYSARHTRLKLLPPTVTRLP